MEPTIVNPQAKYARVGLTEPPATGYLLLAAVAGPAAGRTPFPRRGPRKAALLAGMKALAASLEQLDTASKATVYRAGLIPPPNRDALRMGSRPARYDAAALVETSTVAAVDDVAEDPTVARRYALASLQANRTAAIPIRYHLA